MLVELVSAYALVVSNAPTNGQLLRELRTSQEAFDMADLNMDGQISDLEFDAYKRARRGGATPAGSTELVATVDYNRDGALVPCEMYAEAKCLDGYRRPATSATQRDCRRQDGYYKVDDRNGAVYCPEY